MAKDKYGTRITIGMIICFILGYIWGYTATVPNDGPFGKNIVDIFYEESGSERRLIRAFFGEDVFRSKRWKNIERCVKEDPAEYNEL